MRLGQEVLLPRPARARGQTTWDRGTPLHVWMMWLTLTLILHPAPTSASFLLQTGWRGAGWLENGTWAPAMEPGVGNPQWVRYLPLLTLHSSPLHAAHAHTPPTLTPSRDFQLWPWGPKGTGKGTLRGYVVCREQASLRGCGAILK